MSITPNFWGPGRFIGTISLIGFLLRSAGAADSYTEEPGSEGDGKFTIGPTGFRNHNDAWVLRPSGARARLRDWLREALK